MSDQAVPDPYHLDHNRTNRIALPLEWLLGHEWTQQDLDQLVESHRSRVPLSERQEAHEVPLGGSVERFLLISRGAVSEGSDDSALDSESEVSDPPMAVENAVRKVGFVRNGQAKGWQTLDKTSNERLAIHMRDLDFLATQQSTKSSEIRAANHATTETLSFVSTKVEEAGKGETREDFQSYRTRLMEHVKVLDEEVGQDLDKYAGL